MAHFLGTKDQVKGFLSAFIESEGSVADGGVEVSSASVDLLRGVQLLLLRFGIVATLSEKHVNGYDLPYWRLVWFGDDARIFQNQIGFRSKRKNLRLDHVLHSRSNPNKDVVPHSIGLVSGLKSKILLASSRTGSNKNRMGSGIAQFGESFQSTLKHIINGRRDPTYQWLRKLLKIADQLNLSTTDEYTAISNLVKQGFFYDPVVSIETSESEVMDIEVEDPQHCYIANGLISHNTLQAIAALCYIWDRDPTMKVMVVCPKSAIGQWASEIDKFSIGIKYFIASGTLEQRKAAYLAWFQYSGMGVLVVNYHGVIRDWDQGITKEPPPEGAKKGTQAVAGLGFLDKLTSKIPRITVIFDEITACKNPSTKTHQTCKFLSAKAKRAWGLTATLLAKPLDGRIRYLQGHSAGDLWYQERIPQCLLRHRDAAGQGRGEDPHCCWVQEPPTLQTNYRPILLRTGETGRFYRTPCPHNSRSCV